MFPFVFLNPLPVLISLSTMFGIVVHDTKIDQLTVAIVTVPAVVASYDIASKVINPADGHTHSERMSLSQMVRDINNDNPRTTPRNQEKKRKYLMQRNVPRGRHAFDNYNLPIV